jgi:hypothetical protein
MKERPWTAPKTVEERDAGEALRNLPIVERLCQPCPRETVSKWLATLGVMCAGQQLTAADAKAKISAYSAHLNHPASCFTNDTLNEAARKFKWFPSYAEVAEFLDLKAQQQLNMRFRLEKIAGAKVAEKPRPGKSWQEMTADERAKFNEIMAGVRDRFPTNRDKDSEAA